VLSSLFGFLLECLAWLTLLLLVSDAISVAVTALFVTLETVSFTAFDISSSSDDDSESLKVPNKFISDVLHVFFDNAGAFASAFVFVLV